MDLFVVITDPTSLMYTSYGGQTVDYCESLPEVIGVFTTVHEAMMARDSYLHEAPEVGEDFVGIAHVELGKTYHNNEANFVISDDGTSPTERNEELLHMLSTSMSHSFEWRT